MSAKGGSRYNKRVARKDPKTLNFDSPEYWEAILKREGLGMQRGKSKKLVFGHEYFDSSNSKLPEESE